MRIIIFILLISCSNMIYAQYTSYGVDSSDIQVQAYLKKARQNSKAGLVLGGTGITFVVLGGVISMSKLAQEIGDLLEPDENSRNRKKLAEFFALTGVVMMAGSVPFFIQSSKYKKKAARLVIGQSSVQHLPGLQIASKQVQVGIVVTL